MNKAFLVRSLVLLGVLLVGGVLWSAEGDKDEELREMEESFGETFVPAWYPRVVDEKAGGYFSDFDAKWKRKGRQDKFIVSQARHLWMTSQLALFTGEERYREYAEHGYQYLRDAMWDEAFGGYHSLLRRNSNEVVGRGKNAYGTAFAIYGLAAYYKVSGDEEVLELAKRTFAWLEEKSWDAEFGGYVDLLEEDGSWSGDTEERVIDDPKRHVGLKDYNSSIHLLEALTALYEVWPDKSVRERLEGMLEIVRDRFVGEKGYLQLYFYRDWTPLTLRGEGAAYVKKHYYFDHVSWGHDVETAFLMLEASHALGLEDDAKTREVAKRLVDHALATGWDKERGGLREAGYYFEEDGACEVIEEDKVWWVAAEGLNAFLMMSQLYPENGEYWEAFLDQWKYVQEYLVDRENGGWFMNGLDTNPEVKAWAKSQIWKTSYHDGRAYMNCIRMLRGEFELTGGGH